MQPLCQPATAHAHAATSELNGPESLTRSLALLSPKSKSRFYYPLSPDNALLLMVESEESGGPMRRVTASEAEYFDQFI